MDIEDAVSRFFSIFEEHKNTTFNINNLSDSDYILSHLRIGLQKESSENLVKMSTEFEGIDIDVAWQNAKNNTFKETKIVSMAKVIADLTGFDYSEEMEEGMKIDDFSEMVASVNITKVSPEQRLTNRAYIIQL